MVDILQEYQRLTSPESLEPVTMASEWKKCFDWDLKLRKLLFFEDPEKLGEETIEKLKYHVDENNEYLHAIQLELQGRGQPGVAAIRNLFFEGNAAEKVWLRWLAGECFKSEAISHIIEFLKTDLPTVSQRKALTRWLNQE